MGFNLAGFAVASFDQEVTIRSSITFDSRGTSKFGLGKKYKFARVLPDGKGTLAIELFETVPNDDPDARVFEFHVKGKSEVSEFASLTMTPFFRTIKYAPSQKLRAAYRLEESEGRKFIVLTLPRFGVDVLTESDAQVVEDDVDTDPVETLSEDEIKAELTAYFSTKLNVKLDEVVKHIHKKDDTILRATIVSMLEEIGIKDAGGGFLRSVKNSTRWSTFS